MVKAELNTLRLQIHEKDRVNNLVSLSNSFFLFSFFQSELNLNSELERARHHARQYEDELKSLRTKYDDVCERVSAATHQLERVKIVLEETSRRCEQLEKEKVSNNQTIVFVLFCFVVCNHSLIRLVQLRKKLV